MAYDYSTISQNIPDYEQMPDRFMEKETPKPQSPPNTQQLITDIFNSAAPPPPVYDEAAQRRIERVAKLNAAGRGLSVLGDIISLGAGANVNRREPDNVTPAMLSSYDSYIRDYQNRMDNHAYQTWRNELANKHLLLNEAHRAEDKATEEARYKDTKEYRDEQLKRQSSQDEFAREQFDYRKEQDKKQEELAKEKFEWQKQLPYIQSSLAQAKQKGELAEWMQKETLKLQFNKEKNKYYLYDNAGKPRAAVNSEGDIQKLYDVITSDPAVKEEANGLMEALRAELGEGVTMNHMKIIVSKLWDRSEAARQYLGVQEQKQPQPEFNMGSYTRPEYKGPVRNDSDTVTPPPTTTGQALPENDINNPDPLELGL